MAALAILLLGPAALAGEARPLSIGRSTEVELAVAGRAVRAAATVSPVPANDGQAGLLTGVAKTRIARLHLEVGGKAVAVPLSAVADLYDPHWIDLTAEQYGYRLRIEGSDGADGYAAEIFFDQKRVTRRRILVAGDRTQEETVYREVVVD
ncbi:MAG TPA: hypothetical protein VNZ85_11020 [Caulobacter sp.]|nr:hypothetical protein [Caulobacter sp.]